jgi:branched-chain amino acid transport system permease protein
MMNRPFASDVGFGLALAIFLVVGLVVGGAGTVSGAVPGAMIYVFVPYFMSEWTADQDGMPPVVKQVTAPLFDWLENRQGGDAIAGVFFGLGLLLFVFLLPGGFVDGMRRLRSRVVRVIPNPSWLRHARTAKATDSSVVSGAHAGPDELATST